MFKEKKVIVVMPAYNAEHTLRKIYDEVIRQDYVDQFKASLRTVDLLVSDHSYARRLFSSRHL